MLNFLMYKLEDSSIQTKYVSQFYVAISFYSRLYSHLLVYPINIIMYNRKRTNIGNTKYLFIS